MRLRLSSLLVGSAAWRPCLAAAVLLALAGCGRSGSPLELPVRPDASPAALVPSLNDAEAAIRRAPESAATWAGLGSLYQANGFAEPSVACYREAIARGSDAEGRWHYLLALALESAGQSDAADAALAQALERRPGFVPALIRRGDLATKRGEAEPARAFYRSALAQDADCPEALLALARDELRGGDDAGALRRLEQLAATHPEYGSGVSLRAQVLERQGRGAEAAALRAQGRTRKDPPMADPWLDEVMLQCVDVTRLGIQFEDALNSGRIDQALATLDRIETLDPDSWLPLRMRAFTFAHTGRHEEAVAEYRKAIAHGGDPTLTYPGLVAALRQLGRTAEAERAAAEGLAVAPASCRLLVMLAEIRVEQQRTAEAEQLLQQALAADDRDLAAHRLLARLEWESDRRTSAVSRLEKLVGWDPTDVTSRALLGQHWLEQGAPAAALEPLTQATALAPDNERIRDLAALAHLRAGNAQAREQRVEGALASYDAAIRLRPNQVEPYVNRTRLLAFLRRFAEAESAAQPLLRLRPDDPAVHLLLGDIRHASGDHGGATASWTRAEALITTTTDAALRTAVAQRLAGANATP